MVCVHYVGPLGVATSHHQTSCDVLRSMKDPSGDNHVCRQYMCDVEVRFLEDDKKKSVGERVKTETR